jgi:hypothetical protein
MHFAADRHLIGVWEIRTGDWIENAPDRRSASRVPMAPEDVRKLSTEGSQKNRLRKRVLPVCPLCYDLRTSSPSIPAVIDRRATVVKPQRKPFADFYIPTQNR